MRPGDDVEVYLCRDIVDLRKSINGLSILVEQALGLDPFAEKLFVFCNRKRDKVKILYWERSGFVLWYKRLEKHRFPWPDECSDAVVSMTGRELNWLLDGIDWFRLKPHASLCYESVL
ncbi:MAG: IS66 family insertion sequence element accessory protein TnpB [Deltaproteobacteria bacterium]|nr:IS66 family insertion sequence element accessory protein TnpB [Deltaproteobacteria bacterium]